MDMLDSKEGARLLEPMLRVRRPMPQLRRGDIGCTLLLAAVPLLMLAAPLAGALTAAMPMDGGWQSRWRCLCPPKGTAPLTPIHVLIDGWPFLGGEAAHVRAPTTMSQSFAIGRAGYYFSAAGSVLRVDAWLGDEESGEPIFAVRDYRRPPGPTTPVLR